MRVDFDLAGYQRIARAVLKVSEAVAIVTLRLKGQAVRDAIHLPEEGSPQWRLLHERY